ncbi:MAG: DUF1573 domain-containing protein [Bacteroidota bacterium]
MNRIFMVLVLVFSMATVTMAQVDAASAERVEEAQTAGAKMEFESTTIDYGTIVQNADPYRVFKFKNTGSAPLVIKHAKGSCGCTVPQWPKEPIAPGDDGEIKVRYDTKRIGSFTKRVTLTTNVEGDNIVLTIKGKVEKQAQEEGVPANDNMFNGGF